MKILFRATNWVGDVVISLPALRAVRMSFPESHIAVLCRPWVAPLYQLRPEPDEVLVEEPSTAHKGYQGRLALASLLRSKGFERAIILPTSFDSAHTVFRSGIPERFGYRGELRSLLLTHSLSLYETAGEHQVYKYLRLAALSGAGIPAHPDTSWTVSKKEREAAATLLRNAGWKGGPFVAAHAASFAHRAKRWPAGRFVEVFKRLAQDHELVTTVLLGSASEAPLNQEIAGQLEGCECIDLSARTTLQDVLGILSLASLFIGNDSGIGHLAGASGIPTVTVFGPTDPEATRPWDGPRPDGRPARIAAVRNPVLCSPCRFTRCPMDHVCMRGVTPEMVLEAAHAVMA